MNPLLAKAFDTPFNTVPFDKIKSEHFIPGLKNAVELSKKQFDEIKKIGLEQCDFVSVVEAIEGAGEQVGTIAEIFFNLYSAESTEELKGISKEFSAILSEYSSDITLDAELFEKVQCVYEKRANFDLSVEGATLLEKIYLDFVRNGASLDENGKKRFREIDKELSELKLEYGDHILDETNSYMMVISDKKELVGLPESAVENASQKAKEKGKDGSFVFTLEHPSYLPFLKYSSNRLRREELYRAFSSRCFKGDKNDNSEIIKKIVRLYHERAGLLGYQSHADFVLERRMASTVKNVKSFLDEMFDSSCQVAKKEMKELKEYAVENGGPRDLMRWDSSYYFEKLKKNKFNLDDEELRPYFKLENVKEGVFKIAGKLYGLVFEKNSEISVYHPDVESFEVKDQSGKHVGVFYVDFLPRDGKRSGAWMTNYRTQRMSGGNDVRPHVSIVCNFTRPTKSRPSLLTFDEVTTLFHEFGHALHGLLSKCKYHELASPNVFWDFVELPSQIMENWAYEKECLDMFAAHYETGEKIPGEMIEKIRESSNFMEGAATLRQLSLGMLDMAWYSADPSGISDISEFETNAMKKTCLLPVVEGCNMSAAFAHIFRGGYSSGYYSYKWAEVLDADAFELFKEKGIFNKDVADSFKQNILERGGSEHPMTLYKRFRGAEPKVSALLKRSGLIS